MKSSDSNLSYSNFQSADSIHPLSQNAMTQTHLLASDGRLGTPSAAVQSGNSADTEGTRYSTPNLDGTTHSFCNLPNHYFDRALLQRHSGRARSGLSVQVIRVGR